MCVHATRPTASYRALDLGGSAAEVGIVAASYAVLSAVAAVPLGRAIDRYRPRPFFLGGSALLVAAAATSAAAGSIVVLAFGQALLGLGQVAAAISFQTIVADVWRMNRDRGFARVGVAASSGQLMGPLLAGAILDLELGGDLLALRTSAAFAAAGTLGVVSFAVAWGGRRYPSAPAPVIAREEATAPARIGSIVRRSGMPPALIASIAVLTALDLLIAYLPVIGEERGIGPAVIGGLLALRAGAGLASRLNLAAMLRRFGKRRLLVGAMASASGAMVGVALSHDPWIIGPLVAVIGYSLGVGSPMTMAWVVSRAPHAGRGTALAVRMTGNRVGQILVPAAVGGLAALFGPGAVFLVVSGTLLASSSWVRTSPIDEDPYDG